MTPNWINDPYSKVNKNESLAAVGSGNSRLSAENNARANLISQFELNFTAHESIIEIFEHVVRSDGAESWYNHLDYNMRYSLVTGIDNLAGSEIAGSWENRRGVHFSLVALDLQRASRVYTDIVRANLSTIDILINIPEIEKYSLNGYSRLQLAGAIADLTYFYGNILRQIGTPVQGIRNGDLYRIEAMDILRTIPVSIVISKAASVDTSNKIQSAFAGAISNLGLLIGDDSSRYVLDISIFLTPVTFSNSRHFWSRIEIIANLNDSYNDLVLLPFSFNERDGHSSQEEADHSAILSAENRIINEYSTLLGNYLFRLLPQS
ncbi:MAG: LPP20 family lipoprotein [Treponema sp.]|nr:LPP20 family lipoprotein [Treponema sp.]